MRRLVAMDLFIAYESDKIHRGLEWPGEASFRAGGVLPFLSGEETMTRGLPSLSRVLSLPSAFAKGVTRREEDGILLARVKGVRVR